MSNSSLYGLSQQSLTVSLLKLRSAVSNKSTTDSTTFSFPELAERIKVSNGIEVIHLISALPHSGLRPDLLEFLEYHHPVLKLQRVLFLFYFSLDNVAFFRKVLERSLC